MACANSVVKSVASINQYADSETNGNDVYNIPVKVGAPLSTACERANIIGNIPEVIRHPAFTVVNGGIPARRVSSGGISEVAMATIFNRRGSVNGCFGDVPSYGSTCC